jgi:hypothetical protein
MQTRNDNARETVVFINQKRVTFQHAKQTGLSIKQHAHIPDDHVLCLEMNSEHSHHESKGRPQESGAELAVIENCQHIELQNGQHFWSHAAQAHAVVVKINRVEYEFCNPQQTGLSLKERAGIPLGDVLFRDQPEEDEVIPDDVVITLHCDDCFHSAPPANYGSADIAENDVGFKQFETHGQPDGWIFLVVRDYPLPDGFTTKSATLLIKLPPMFPDAAPDMFWLNPHIKTASGTAPQGVSDESILGINWQRFSWHLTEGAWRPGISTLRDYMRCVRARLEKRN